MLPSPIRVRDDLKHIRVIAFAMLLVSATIAYFVLLGWATRRDLLGEVDDLRLLVHYIQEANGDAQVLYQLFPDVGSDNLLSLAPTIAEQTEFPAGWSDVCSPGNVRTPMCIETPNPSFNKVGTSLASLRGAVTSAAWTVRLPENKSLRLSDESIEEVKNWYRPNSLLAPPITTESDILITELDLSDWANRRGTVTLAYYGTMYAGGTPPPRPVRPKLRASAAWSSEETAELAFSDERFQESFPLIAANWDSIKLRTLEQTRRYAHTERYRDVAGQRVQLLGLKIDGRHVGWIGPIILVCLLFYLWAHLAQLKAVLSDASVQQVNAAVELSQISPWVGAMRNSVAVFVTVVVVVAAPALSSMTSFWQLVGFRWWVACLVALPALGVGVWCVSIGQSIARRHVAEPETTATSSAAK